MPSVKSLDSCFIGFHCTFVAFQHIHDIAGLVAKGRLLQHYCYNPLGKCLHLNFVQKKKEWRNERTEISIEENDWRPQHLLCLLHLKRAEVGSWHLEGRLEVQYSARQQRKDVNQRQKFLVCSQTLKAFPSRGFWGEMMSQTCFWNEKIYENLKETPSDPNLLPGGPYWALECSRAAWFAARRPSKSNDILSCDYKVTRADQFADSWNIMQINHQAYTSHQSKGFQIILPLKVSGFDSAKCHWLAWLLRCGSFPTWNYLPAGGKRVLAQETSQMWWEMRERLKLFRALVIM